MKAETSWGFMRGIQLNPTYSTVVQPCYMYISVSGCVVYSYASGFEHICLSALCCQLLVQYSDRNTLTLTYTVEDSQWWIKQDEEQREEKKKKHREWLYPVSSRIFRLIEWTTVSGVGEKVLRQSVRAQSTASLRGSAYCSVNPPALVHPVKSRGELPLPSSTPQVLQQSEGRGTVGGQGWPTSQQSPVQRSVGHHTRQVFSGTM